MKKITKLMLTLALCVLGVGSANAVRTNATFSTPAANGSWNSGSNTYSWTGGTNNLMTIFTFPNGELANYTSIHLTTSDYTDSYRICFMNGSTAVSTIAFYSAGQKDIIFADRNETKNLDMSTITHISFGGNSGSGSVGLTNVYIEGPDIAYPTAKREKVFEMDWTKAATYPYYRMGVPQDADKNPLGSYDVQDGALVIVNDATGKANWEFQPYVADGLTLSVGATYEIDVTYKSTVAGNVDLSMGTWDDAKGESITLVVTDEWKTATASISGYPIAGDNNIHICFQCGARVGTIKIAKVEVFLITPAAPAASVNYGDLVSVTPTLYTKHGDGGGNAIESVADGDGVYTIHSITSPSADWDTQFWIGTSKAAYPAGQKFKIKFDYKADAAATVYTQTHGGATGPYITWHCIGDLAFTDKWQTFEEEITLGNDMGGWMSVAFNLNVLTTENNYYFRNISLQVPEVSEAVSFSISNAGWATFCYDKSVALAVAKGYAAKYNGSNIQLSEVTEVPANNCVLIEAAPGISKYSFGVIKSATAIAENDLLVSDGLVVSDGATIYALSKGENGVGFYKVKSGVKIPLGKAYMVIPAAGAREFIGFGNEEEVTGIQTIKAASADKKIFNLNGQRIAQPVKGLNIIGGKKVMIK